MPNRFCAICGNTLNEDSPHYGMCLNCYLLEHPLFDLLDEFIVNVCLDCGSYSRKDVWHEPSEDDLFTIVNEIVQKFILKQLTKNPQLDVSFSINENSMIYSSKDLLKSVEVLVTGNLKKNADLSQQKLVKLKINYMLCKNCSNLRSGTYYTSVLQLRVKDVNQLYKIPVIIQEVNSFVESLFKKDHRQYISIIKDQKYGVDLYLSTNEIMNRVIKFLQTKYHFLLKRTKKLVGRDTQKGKNLYRLKSLIKLLPVSPNDVILINNEEYIIESITKSKVILRSSNNTKLIKEYSYFFNEKVIIRNDKDLLMEESNKDFDEDFEEYDDIKKFDENIDEIEKNKIDYKRIRRIDQSKKRAVIESVFDERTVFYLNKLLVNGPLSRIEGVISAGKEANVYLAYDKNEKEVAVKIYKIDNNTSRWMRKYIVGDPRFKKVPHNVSKIIFLWASKEFKNLKRAHKAGLSVPMPIHISNNILIMEYIGFESIPAPLLKDIKNPKEPSILFNEILNFIKILYQKAKLVHGDLSEFNILYHNQKLVVIDISQAVSIQHPKAEVYLARDIKNIFNYFKKLGIRVPDPEDFYYDVINLEV
ncbi:MAG: RIO1 family regulatory kinase/ATPase [Promethearchaeota archaeon]